MQITRFIDDTGAIGFGTPLEDGRVQRLSTRHDGLPDPNAGPGETVQPQRLLAPILPRAIWAIGLNYRAHAQETGSQIPERPVPFMKNPASVNDPGAPIRLPRVAQGPEVDFEAELAVVIGREARNVDTRNALDYVLGFTAGNDVSARWWQKRGCQGQWVRGKSFDTFCPLGPVIVTPDEIGDPQDLGLTTRLNGEVMQRGHTADMIFAVSEILAFLSQDTTLLPGTVILTGTPPGVGAARDPKVFLQPGDVVEVAIEKIGVLRNPVVAAD